ncbi:MAG: Kelch repeat-containing protein, partial [Planctomycetota bacterium]
DGAQGIAAFSGNLMACPRDQHSANLLTTGYGQGVVVVIGGERDDFVFQPLAINTAEVYDHSLYASTPVFNGAQGLWSPVGMSMVEKRCMHSGTLLNTGRILVAGGYNFVGAGVSRTAELFDPFGMGNNINAPWSGIDNTGNFDWTRDPQGNQTFIPNVFTGVAHHKAVTLINGRVLLCGGHDEFFGIPIPSTLCWIYTP